MKFFFEKGVEPEVEVFGIRTHQEFVASFSRYPFRENEEVFLRLNNGELIEVANSEIAVMRKNASRRFYVDMEMKDFFEKFGAKTLFIDSEGVLTFKKPECSDADSDCYECS